MSPASCPQAGGISLFTLQSFPRFPVSPLHFPASCEEMERKSLLGVWGAWAGASWQRNSHFDLCFWMHLIKASLQDAWMSVRVEVMGWLYELVSLTITFQHFMNGNPLYSCHLFTFGKLEGSWGSSQEPNSHMSGFFLGWGRVAKLEKLSTSQKSTKGL